MNQHTETLELVRSSELFDREWYLQRYPDVALLSMDPAEHYVRIGARLRRDPSPNFSTLGYLQAYPDVEKSGFNPLYHFLKWGKAEGRLAPFSRAALEDRQAMDIELRLAEKREAAPQPVPLLPPAATKTSAPSGSELEQELAAMKKKCEELTEENELLLLQLHQVQEELEEYFLKYQELAGKSIA